MTGSDFCRYIDNLSIGDDDRRVRYLSLFSAIIAVGDEHLTESAIGCLYERGMDREALYEAILQSYLFLGFPRMIEAALAFNRVIGNMTGHCSLEAVTPEESGEWFERGINLCRRVYGKNYEVLRKRFLEVSPEIFRWMVIEGYGKVLCRPGMTHIERELAEVAALIVDRRERQLVSHILGSLNVGAEMPLIRIINRDIRPLAGETAHELANRVIRRIQEKYETQI